jgi:predicted nuclease of predicted toxin-antitoxin system
MNFFLDENFPKQAKLILEHAMHQVFDLRGTKDEGISDIQIFAMAKQHQAIFLTTDKDFYHTIHYNHKPHPGIIVIALGQPNGKNILDKLNWFLSHGLLENIENKCYLITDLHCKIFC